MACGVWKSRHGTVLRLVPCERSNGEALPGAVEGNEVLRTEIFKQCAYTSVIPLLHYCRHLRLKWRHDGENCRTLSRLPLMIPMRKKRSFLQSRWFLGMVRPTQRRKQGGVAEEARLVDVLFTVTERVVLCDCTTTTLRSSQCSRMMCLGAGTE